MCAHAGLKKDYLLLHRVSRTVLNVTVQALLVSMYSVYLVTFEHIQCVLYCDYCKLYQCLVVTFCGTCGIHMTLYVRRLVYLFVHCVTSHAAVLSCPTVTYCLHVYMSLYDIVCVHA